MLVDVRTRDEFILVVDKMLHHCQLCRSGRKWTHTIIEIREFVDTGTIESFYTRAGFHTITISQRYAIIAWCGDNITVGCFDVEVATIDGIG